MGMFTKIADESKGSIDSIGKMPKPLTEKDIRSLEKGDDICKDILVRAGEHINPGGACPAVLT